MSYWNRAIAVLLLLVTAGCQQETPVTENAVTENAVTENANKAVASPAATQCGDIGTTLSELTDYVKNACYQQTDSGWTAADTPRETTFLAEADASPMVHNYVRANYSPTMVNWLEQYRPSGETAEAAPAIPDGSAIVLEVYDSKTAAKSSATLSMVRHRESWIFARYQPATDQQAESAQGGLNYPSCRGCHAFENPQFLYASHATMTTNTSQKLSLEIADNPGQITPAPVFQRGDTLSERLPDDSPLVAEFIATFSEHTNQPLPILTADDVVHFPPQSLDQVQEGPDSDGVYPILCKDCFYTAEFCAACHSSTTSGTVDSLPQMTYESTTVPHGDPPDKHYYANWSMYGEYSVSIMGLASRDPIWQAQVEQELNYNSGVDETIITNVCFRCHGPMGQRQLMDDTGEQFNRFTFFSVYEDNPAGYVNPYPDEPAAAPEFALYGSLARDGISCTMCHFMGPNNSSGAPNGIWNGEDYQVFYGPMDESISQREDPHGPPYPFIGEPQYRTDGDVLGPTSPSFLNQEPMLKFEALGLDLAYNEKTTNGSYLREGQFCGSCHSLVVPKIPTGYVAGGSVAEITKDSPYYTKPETCTGDNPTFAADGNPVNDPCVALAYEQTTFWEWANSDFPDEDTICQTCHMPLINAAGEDHTAMVAQFEGAKTTKPKTYRRHRVMGINLFVSEMYQQFDDVLGIDTVDSTVPANGLFVTHNLLNAEQSIVEQATYEAQGLPGTAAVDLEIVSTQIADNKLTVVTLLTNNAGHKFPSGAGFRRAFIQLQIKDESGQVIWSSGQPNKFGIICDGVCDTDGKNILPSEFPTMVVDNYTQLQPHRDLITAQGQVQIYEVKEIDDIGYLTSRTLSLFKGAKDNRIQPKGWVPPEERCDAANKDTMLLGLNLCTLAEINDAESMVPGSELDNDPYYHNSDLTGQDQVTYAIPLADLGSNTPKSVTATLYYQSIPPGFLVQRFNEGFINDAYGDATAREIFLTSHLNLDLGLKGADPENPFELIDGNWSMVLDTTTTELD